MLVDEFLVTEFVDVSDGAVADLDRHVDPFDFGDVPVMADVHPSVARVDPAVRDPRGVPALVGGPGVVGIVPFEEDAISLPVGCPKLGDHGIPGWSGRSGARSGR